MNKIDVFDKLLKENNWKFPKGYPDISNKEDRDLLESIINGYLSEEEEEVELEDDKEILNIKTNAKIPAGGSQIYDDTIRHAIYGDKWKDQPIPSPKKKYPFKKDTFSLSVDPLDMDMWKKLFPISPPKVGNEIGSEGSKGVGNGEVALYWLYRFSESAKVEEGRSGDDPDLFFDNDGVEVKAWKKHQGMHGLGRFGADKENLSLLAIIFGFNALATIFGSEGASRTVNPTNFNGDDLVQAMENVKKFKNLIDSNEQLSGDYPIFQTIKENTDRLYSSFDFGSDESAEDMATKVASKVVGDKLERKPGDGNHLVNVMSDGSMKFFLIDFKKLEENPDFLKDFKIAQSAIAINFDKIWG